MSHCSHERHEHNRLWKLFLAAMRSIHTVVICILDGQIIFIFIFCFRHTHTLSHMWTAGPTCFSYEIRNWVNWHQATCVSPFPSIKRIREVHSLGRRRALRQNQNNDKKLTVIASRSLTRPKNRNEQTFHFRIWEGTVCAQLNNSTTAGMWMFTRSVVHILKTK